MTINNRNNSERVFINHGIRAPKILCIDHENVNLGIISTSQALQLAMEQSLDLVQVAPPTKDRPPTCKIINYGKWKYENSKKKKESDRKQRESFIKEKEIWFRPTTDTNDLQIKAKKVEELIADNCRVKVKIKFTGREISHKEVAMSTLDAFLNMLPEIQCESHPQMDGKFLLVNLVKKIDKSKKL